MAALATVVSSLPAVGRRAARLTQCQRFLMFSSTADDAADRKILRAPFKKVVLPSNPALFPWRHEVGIPTRIKEDKEMLTSEGDLFFRPMNLPKSQSNSLAMAMLGASWATRNFFRSAWRDDLLEDMTWAFSRAVYEEIIQNIYRVPPESATFDNGTSSIDFRHTFDMEKNLMKSEDDNNFAETGVVEGMLEPKLRSLYESAHAGGKNRLEIRLQTTPLDSFLIFLSYLPLVTRENASEESKEQLPPMSTIQDVIMFLVLHREEPVTRGTVVCQIAIVCEEVFWVRDLTTGAIVQGVEGDSQPRTVTHLVRMERVVEARRENRFGFNWLSHTPIGNWQITDIDDLLDGNLII